MAPCLSRVGVVAGALLVAACAAAPDEGQASSRAGVHGSPRSAPYAGVSNARDPIAACGDGPHVDLVVTLMELRDTGEIAPLPRARVTFDACPSYAVTTDEFGMATARVPRGVPIVTTLSADGHVTSLISQNTLNDDAIVTDFLPTTAMAKALPGLSPDSGTIAVYLEALGSGACAYVDGASLRVVGHPEAKVVYMSTRWPVDPAPTTATASVGAVVFVTGLPDGDIELEGTKPGCRVSATSASSQTGRFEVAHGMWTVGNVFVDD